MTIRCSKWHIDEPNDYFFPKSEFETSSNDGNWEVLFPVGEDGNRWYAASVAFKFSENHTDSESWDDNFGENYPVFFEGE